MVHVITAVALVLVAVGVGAWGLLRSRRLAQAGSSTEARWFAQLLQLSHTLVLAVGVLGLALLLEGHRIGDPLHVRVYGPFMLVAIVAAYGYRTGDARRNIIVFACASLVIAALGLRAFTTG
jgi:hypothetical protein